MLEEQLQIAAVAAGLLVVLLVLLRLTRRPQSSRGKPIALSSTHQLHVVEVEGRRLLVGTGPSGPPQLISELAELPAWIHSASDAWTERDAR